MADNKKTTATATTATTNRVKTTINFNEIASGGADGAIWEMANGTYDLRILKSFKSGKGTELLGTTQGIATVRSIAYAASLNPKALASLKDGDVFAFDTNTTYSMTISDKKITSLVIKGDA